MWRVLPKESVLIRALLVITNSAYQAQMRCFAVRLRAVVAGGCLRQCGLLPGEEVFLGEDCEVVVCSPHQLVTYEYPACLIGLVCEFGNRRAVGFFLGGDVGVLPYA